MPSPLPDPTLLTGRWWSCFQSATIAGLKNVNKKGKQRGALERNDNVVTRVREKGVHTEIDPNATRRKDAVDDTKVVHDVLGLASGAEWDRV